MPQHTAVIRPSHEYDRTDYTALRAYFMGLELEFVLENYYSESVALAKGLHSVAALRAYLNEMRDHLADGLMRQNPPLAQSLRTMQQTGRWGQLALEFIAEAAWQRRAAPVMDDDLGKWLKPVVTRCLSREHIHTVGDLCAYITARGPTWWRSIPRIGQGKARVIAQWVQTTMGVSVPSALIALEPNEMHGGAWQVWDSANDARSQAFELCLRLPLSRLDWSHSGQGKNRHLGRCQIQAHTDWDVFDIYLQRFVDRTHTLKSYRKEMERFLLWVRTVAHTSLSDVDVSDCQAYCQFMAAPAPTWVAAFAAPRGSALWRPFVGPLTAKGIAYAQKILGGWFQWLVDVQYLAGNPWKAIHKPLLLKTIHPIQIERALDKELWQRLSEEGGVLDQLCSTDEATLIQWLALKHSPRVNVPAQYRLWRAAVLLMGHTGLRVSEAAGAMRHKISWRKTTNLYRLDVVGKGHKERFVMLPSQLMRALEAHWQDYEACYGGAMPAQGRDPLLSPVNFFAPTPHEKTVHDISFFSGKDLSQMIIKGMQRVANSPAFGWTPAEREALLRLGSHGLRHTFATLGIQDEDHPVPIDLMKDLLGHSSLQTTSLYVQHSIKHAEKVMSQFFKST